MEVTAMTVDKFSDVKFRVSFNLRIFFFGHAAEARRKLAYVT